MNHLRVSAVLLTSLLMKFKGQSEIHVTGKFHCTTIDTKQLRKQVSVNSIGTLMKVLKVIMDKIAMDEYHVITTSVLPW